MLILKMNTQQLTAGLSFKLSLRIFINSAFKLSLRIFINSAFKLSLRIFINSANKTTLDMIGTYTCMFNSVFKKL